MNTRGLNSEHRDFLEFAGKMRHSVVVRATVFEILTVCVYVYLIAVRPETHMNGWKSWMLFLTYLVVTPCIVGLAEYTKIRYIKAHRFLAECFQAQSIPKGWRRYLFQCFEKHDAKAKDWFDITPVLYKFINAYESMESL
jgi:hypothetical protein